MWAQGSDAFDESDDDWAMPNETKAIFNLPSWLWRRGGDPPPFDCVNVGKGECEWKGRDKGEYLGEVEVVWEGEDEEGEYVEVDGYTKIKNAMAKRYIAMNGADSDEEE